MIGCGGNNLIKSQQNSEVSKYPPWKSSFTVQCLHLHIELIDLGPQLIYFSLDLLTTAWVLHSIVYQHPY